MHCYRQPRFLLGRYPISFLLLLIGAWGLLVSARADIEDLAFSDDGQFIACLTSEGDFFVNRAGSMAPVYRIEEIAKGNRIAWRPGSHQVVLPLDEGNGWDLWIVEIDGKRRQLTSHPALDCEPCWMPDGQSLSFVSFRNGDADIMEYKLVDSSVRTRLPLPFDQWSPLNQPHNDALAFISMHDSETQAWVALPGQEPLAVDNMDPGSQFPDWHKIGWDSTGDYLLYTRQGISKTELMMFAPVFTKPALLIEDDHIHDFLMHVPGEWLIAGPGKHLLYYRLGNFLEDPIKRPVDLLANGMALSKPTLCLAPGNPRFAAIAQSRYVAISDKPLGEYRFLLFSLEDSLYHAERLRAAKRWDDVEALYRTLLAQAESQEKKARIGLHRVTQLRKAGKNAEALQQIAELSALKEKIIDRAALENMKGEIFFFEMRDYERARAAFQKVRQLAGENHPDLARVHLDILETPDSALYDLYANAHSALRQNDISKTIQNMRLLVDHAGPSPLIFNAVLEILGNPYSDESYSRASNPFESIAYLDPVTDLLVQMEKSLRQQETGRSSPVRVYARFYEELLKHLVRARRFEVAKDIALRRLQLDGAKAMGIPDYLYYYLESERVDTYVHNLLSKVFITDEIFPVLEAQLSEDALSIARLSLARAKLEILEGDLDESQKRLEFARNQFESFSRTDYTRKVAGLQSYLYLFAAKHNERLGLWEEAANSYRTAIALVEEYMPQNLPLYFHLQLSLDSLKYGPAHGSKLWQTQLILRGMGDTMLNPTNEPSHLRIGVRNLLEVFKKNSPSKLDSFLLFHIGYGLARAELPHQAAHFFDRAQQANPSRPAISAILWEKAALYETTENWLLQYESLKGLAPYMHVPAQAHAVQIKMAKPLIELGQFEEANDVLKVLKRNAALEIQRNEADQLMEEIKKLKRAKASRVPIPKVDE
ncbi:MAG: hypothetical protein ACLFUS_12220 [Candidatus Sumerlaeia bacterium]